MAWSHGQALLLCFVYIEGVVFYNFRDRHFFRRESNSATISSAF